MAAAVSVVGVIGRSLEQEQAATRRKQMWDDVTRQMRDEIGDEKLSREERFILQQKYGLVAPQLTEKELRVIRRRANGNGRRFTR